MAGTPSAAHPFVATTDVDTAWFKFDATTKKLTPIKAPMSSDADNIMPVGADGNGKVTQAFLNQYVKVNFAYDATSKKLTVYNPDGSVAGAVDPHVFEGTLTGTSFTNGVISFQDNAGNVVTTLNTGIFLQSVVPLLGQGLASAGGIGTAASPLQLALVIDPIQGNLLKLTAAGLKVSPADIVALFNAQAFSVAVSAANGGITITSGTNAISIPCVVLQDAAGNNVGLLPAYAA